MATNNHAREKRVAKGRTALSDVAVIRVVPIILAISIVATFQINLACAQSGSAAQKEESTSLSGGDFGTLYYLGTFSSAKDLVPRNGICGAFGLVGRPPVRLPEATAKASASHCDAVVDAVAGSQEFGPEDMLFSPAKITSDSKERVIVTDQATNPSIHIFDFNARKHSRIRGGPGRRLRSPSGVAVNRNDELYVTDAQLGAILIYDTNGKFRRYIGDPKGKRLFERPSAIAVDSASGHIYVADPPRNAVVILDAKGNVLSTLGNGNGAGGPGEFSVPTDVTIRNQELFVLDSENFRIQVFDLAGNFHAIIHPESMGHSQSLAIDSLGRIYLDGPPDTVRVFQPDGRLLFQFGASGSGHGEFTGPAGIWIDRLDRIYVADTGNHRVQSFEWGIKHVARLPRP